MELSVEVAVNELMVDVLVSDGRGAAHRLAILGKRPVTAAE